jgi:Tfp pilus assembly protein PilX
MSTEEFTVSLFDLIFAQKGIVLTAGIALLLLLAAIALAAASRIQQAAAARARRKARRIAPENTESTLSEMPDRVEIGQPPSVSTPQDASPQVDQARSVPVQVKPALAAQPAQESQPEQSGQSTTGTVMQDILSSVFTDDEASARREALLSGLDTVDASHLLALCNRVADRLRGHYGSHIGE